VQDPARGLASGFAAPIRDTPDRVGALHTALTALLSARDTLGAAKAPGAEPAPPRTPLAWRELLHALLDDFTEASGARQWLRQEVDKAICSLLPDGQTPRSAAAVRRALQGRFELPAREKPTNNDAVTLARLDPDGVTPAPYIALIGMNSGAFPRVPRWPDWDPRHATLASTAERDPAHDPALRDRHALASAVDGARVGIWISFVGRERLKGAEVPPCVPVAELFEQLPRVQDGPASAGARHPWIPDRLPRWDPELQAAPACAADPARASPAPVLDDPSDAPHRR
jgi:exonuclease V gamma subunit